MASNVKLLFPFALNPISILSVSCSDGRITNDSYAFRKVFLAYIPLQIKAFSIHPLKQKVRKKNRTLGESKHFLHSLKAKLQALLQTYGQQHITERVTNQNRHV